MTSRSRLDEALARHAPIDASEAASLRRIRAMLRWLPSPFDRAADPTHVTGSAIVTDAQGSVLLHRHVRLGLWLQPGGHVESGEDAHVAAVRETLEETGVPARDPGGRPRLLHVDVHEGPLGHVHLDVRWHLVASSGDLTRWGDTHRLPDVDVAWFTPAAARAHADASLASALRALERAQASS